MTEPSERVQLVVTVAVARLGDGVAFLRGNRMMRIAGDADQLDDMVKLLTAGTTIAALHGAFAPSLIDPILEGLRGQGWLTGEDPRPGGAGSCWERQVGYLSLFGPDVLAMQDRLRRSRVGILGVGGIGGLVAQHLVASGVGSLWLIDYDVVTMQNLNRQYLFGVDDIGIPKVDAAVAGLTRLSSETAMQTVNRAVTRGEDLDDLPGDLDVFVLAADTPAGIAEICWQWVSSAAVPMTAAAVGLTSGYWGPLLVPAMGHCWNCWNLARLDAMSGVERQLEAALGAPTPYSFGPFNSAVAGLLAYDVTRFLATGTCLSVGRRGILNVTDGRISFLEPPPGRRCPDHAADAQHASTN